MLDLLFVPIAILYLLVGVALFAFGMNYFYLTYISLRTRPRKTSLLDTGRLPKVTVQLPIYNELYVAERLIAAAAALDYPREMLEIQVLDDSTDETVELVARQVRELSAEGVNIHHVHRKNRQGYKAGALAGGTDMASGEFVAIFDADFIPGPDFLTRALPPFSDSRVAFVQTRWGHVNREYSFLTRLQSLSIDAHFMVEQFARSQAGLWFNFTGTAGIWRKAAIQDAGGWSGATLTEDLELSYRVFFRGWQAVYLRDVEVPAEIPASITAYRRQQGRWARGSLECALKFIPQIWETRLPFLHKAMATLHLSGYCVHLLLAALVVLYPLVLLLNQDYPALVSLFEIGALFNLTAFAPTILIIAAEKQLGKRWLLQLPLILFVSVLGAGMMVNTLRAAASILVNRRPVFERTPKFGVTRPQQAWTQLGYQLKMDWIVFLELALALANAATIALAIHLGNWVIALYAGMFCCGLLFTAGTTIGQSLSVARQQSRIRRGGKK